MDWNKRGNQANIGTFFLTVIIIGLMVWPMVRPSPKLGVEKQTSQSATNRQQKEEAAGVQTLTSWVAPSLLAVCLIVAGIFQWKAAQLRRTAPSKIEGATPNESTTPQLPEKESLTVNIMEGILATQDSATFSIPDIFLLFRVRVLAREPGITVQDWGLQLRFGANWYAMCSRTQIPLGMMFARRSEDRNAIPPQPKAVDKPFDDVASTEPLPV